MPRRLFANLVVAALLLGLPAALPAHDIPNDVTVQVFLKPAGERLSLLVRVPLKAIRDVDFPSRPGKEGYLDLDKTAPLLPDAGRLWISDFVRIYEGERQLANPKVVSTRLALLSDKSFASYEEAVVHMNAAPLDTNVFWDQVFFDVLFEYPIQSDRAFFSIHPGGLTHLARRVATALRFLPPNGAVRAFQFDGDPGLIRLDPRWYQAAARFVHGGFDHILDGTDHLLFLFCLVIPLRRFGALIPVVTAFTVAHSITLIASAYNLAPDALWFPPLIETLIAVSIVYMALENIAGGVTLGHRWMIAFGFGLVHGFGFSFALRETMQFAGDHLLASLLAFNVGVELGQLLVLLLLIPALELLFRFAVAERLGTVILSALVAHVAWHWMAERWTVLSQYQIQWPAFNAALWAGILRWAMLAVIAAGFFWLIASLIRDRRTPREQ